ncbi:putative uncharacterized protein DDB_G0282133 [Octopus bimaculoides]|uniref:putative uncharacterized protein DDB_G0282133 n=1 Tax=Octopus bimaculoides TaxID=37653 RepID=UPI00071D147B|nr:putative uncharacterized protein DDB_G0282133 [Octopus bimaculoides]|eukprot:XP_014781308.1 PREDICTED: putative uncharacterized protein DDB_G0282133 [Octopus bimaculoides]
MELFNINASLKDIRIPPKNAFLKQLSSKSNIVHSIMRLIDKHLNLNNKYSGIFKNKIRVGHSLTNNLATVIASINNNKLDTFYKTRKNTNINHNCQQANGKNLVPNNSSSNNTDYDLINKSPIQHNTSTDKLNNLCGCRDRNNHTKSYIGATNNEMILRYNTHQSTFRNRNKANSTGLSSYIWELKDKNSTIV